MEIDPPPASQTKPQYWIMEVLHKWQRNVLMFLPSWNLLLFDLNIAIGGRET